MRFRKSKFGQNFVTNSPHYILSQMISGVAKRLACESNKVFAGMRISVTGVKQMQTVRKQVPPPEFIRIITANHILVSVVLGPFTWCTLPVSFSFFYQKFESDYASALLPMIYRVKLGRCISFAFLTRE